MREIKFRTWNKSESEMYYNAELTYDFGMNGSSVMEESFGGIITNDDFILMQYTGLKDKNGKEIYEGDIVKLSTGKIIKVVYNRGSFKTQDIEYPNANLYLLEDYMHLDFEVIGNIYKNKESLKEVE